MVPILRKGDIVHFTMPISGRGGLDDQQEARASAVNLQNELLKLGIYSIGWTASTAVSTPQVNLIIRNE